VPPSLHATHAHIEGERERKKDEQRDSENGRMGEKEKTARE